MGKCPNCGSTEFVTEPNQYDILTFENGDFKVLHTEQCEEGYKIFCRECENEVYVTDGKLVLR